MWSRAFGWSLCTVSLLFGITAPNLQAGLFSGTVHGSFSNPQLSGYYLDAQGHSVFQDNTSTAIVVIDPVAGGSQVMFSTGDDAGGIGGPSTIVFRGQTFSNQPGNTEFALGTIECTNGKSYSASLAYGATLTLWIEGAPSVQPISSTFLVMSTTNTSDPIQSADFLEFPSPLNVRFHVEENTGATATLYGTIYGDPELRLSRLADPTTGGFLTSIPEPSSALLLGCGLLAGLALFRRRGARTVAGR